MAISNTPRPGYMYDGSQWVPIGLQAGVPGAKVQSTAPTSPATGDLWVDTSAAVSALDPSTLATQANVTSSINALQGRNLLDNGGFTVWQRGNSIANINADSTYTADRWFVTRGGLLTVSQGSSSPPTGYSAYADMQNKTASNAFIALIQCIETVNALPAAGKQVTLSFWAKARADTAKSKSLNFYQLYGTVTDGRPGSVVPGGQGSVTLAYDSWTFVSVTGSVPANARTLGAQISSAPSGGLAVDDGFLVTGVKLEVGSAATAFQHKSFGEELAECQRFFQTVQVWSGVVSGTSTVEAIIQFPTIMRTNGQATVVSGAHLVMRTPYAARDLDFPSFGLTASSTTPWGMWTIFTGLTGGTGSGGFNDLPSTGTFVNARMNSQSPILYVSADL